MGHKVYISLGSNIEREKHIRAGLIALDKAFEKLRISTVYESEAVGFEGSHFLNLVAEAETDRSVSDVCRVLKQIEDQNGRIRGGKKFAPRTLDLDLLLYDDLVCNTPVVLPREEICHNAFVLLPLSELAPDMRHPLNGQTFAQMWRAFDQASQQLWPVVFTWSNTDS